MPWTRSVGLLMRSLSVTEPRISRPPSVSKGETFEEVGGAPSAVLSPRCQLKHASDFLVNRKLR